MDNDLPYWSILILSGAIATLGLALNSSAVVIGAMLVAPLLARYPLLDVEVLGADTAALGRAGRALRDAGIAGSRVIVTRDSVPTVRLRLRRRD
ncbi:MAG: hypothetical protein WEB88_06650 [Gemmatimonadota bacterium]